MDIITELTELAFATRLKRLSERLMKDVSHLYHKLDVNFEARWFSILYALNLQSPMSITALAKSLRLTHTAVNQLTTEMIKKGLIISSKGKRDERQRFLELSKKGKGVAAKLTPVWEEIRLATKELIASTNCDLLSVIAEIEHQLDEQDMYERVWIRLKGSPPNEIKICEYTPALKKYFKSLNYEWLEEYFKVEKEDDKILSDPNGKIIKTGGAIFFAYLGDEVVGTCALVKHREKTYELAKMAVTKKYQGRGIGRKLIQAVSGRANNIGVKELYLQTSPTLKAANHLYNKFGFRKINKSPFDSYNYNRPTFIMRLTLIKSYK